MLIDLDAEEIRAAIGKRVEVMAFGVPYIGILEAYDEEAFKLHIRDEKVLAVVEQERIEEFRILEENPS